MSDPLLTADDIAARFGINRRTVLEWANRYGWPRTKVGRTIRWTPDQVAQIERLHTVKPKPKRAPKDGRTMRSAARRSA